MRYICFMMTKSIIRDLGCFGVCRCQIEFMQTSAREYICAAQWYFRTIFKFNLRKCCQTTITKYLCRIRSRCSTVYDRKPGLRCCSSIPGFTSSKPISITTFISNLIAICITIGVSTVISTATTTVLISIGITRIISILDDVIEGSSAVPVRGDEDIR